MTYLNKYEADFRKYNQAVRNNQFERDAVPDFVANAVQCRICGGSADRHGSMFQCQKNPGHIADTMTGIFSDCSYPKKG